MGRLDGQIALVTGSDSGIGRATAIAFAREGADVAVTAHVHRDDSQETADRIKESGRRCVIVELDQTKQESVNRMFDDVIEQLGVPTILVNDAGIDSTGKHVKDMSFEEWDAEILTNLYGPFFCSQRFIRELDGTDAHGTIINITSVHQEIPRAGAAGYCAAKAGLRNLTRCLALELAESNITVKNIAPGMVLTPFNQPAIEDPKVREQQTSSIPQKRAAQPEEIAAAAVFLASRDADYIHGSTIYVDGGLMQAVGQGA